MKEFLMLLFIVYFSQITVNAQQSAYDYFGQIPPGDDPVVFAPGIVSADNKNSHALVVSPDGQMIIFSRYPDGTSFILSRENNKWSGPVQSFFQGKEVSFSPDGGRIFYYTGADIYYVKRNSTGWSQPVRPGENINTASQMEYYPCVIKTGDLYFSRDGNWTTGRIMHSRLQNGQYQKAVDLGLPVNNGGATHAWVSPDESYMLFNSPRTGSFTGNDIWASFKQNDGKWTEPENLGRKINSGADAILCPTVSPDGKYMFFTKLTMSSNTGYIYWVSTRIIDSLKTAVIKTGINENPAGPLSLELKQNYPNPFNPSTTISYSLGNPAHIKIKVFNLLGMEIKTVLDCFQDAGRHSVLWDATDNQNVHVASGIYLYRLETENRSILKKMLLLR